ncbi:MAG: hypothetical protein ACREDL_01825, partial [Bradyrhizobium sp.]
GWMASGMDDVPTKDGPDVDKEALFRRLEILRNPVCQFRFMRPVFGDVAPDNVAVVHPELKP